MAAHSSTARIIDLKERGNAGATRRKSKVGHLRRRPSNEERDESAQTLEEANWLRQSGRSPGNREPDSKNYFAQRRRTAPPSPRRPVPISRRLAGSGVGVTGMSTLKSLKVVQPVPHDVGFAISKWNVAAL